MRKLMLILMVGVVLGMTGCAVRQTIPHAYIPEAVTSLNQSGLHTVSVTVTDDRPYVLSGDKETSFIGIYKGGFGNPWDVRTEGELPLAQVLKRDLTDDLRSMGFPIAQENAERQIVVSIREYNFNCYMNCNVWNELLVTIKDAAGEHLHTQKVNEQQVVSGSIWTGPKSAMEKEIPKIYAQMIRNIVRNSPETLAVLKRQER